ncbi:MAG: AbrB/MazE/SpoVT family DNA-binding domain-containing protein [Nitrospirota bacterium]
MQTSRLSQKGQVTLPQKIREIIGVKAGDLIVYEPGEREVTLRRIEPFDAAFHVALSSTVDEWSTKEDERAFQNL